MNAVSSLLPALADALARLAAASPDGVSIKNDVGFSGATIGPGLRLLRSFPYWQAPDAEKAFEITRTHAKQLGIDAAQLAADWQALAPDLESVCVAAADTAREIAAASVEESVRRSVESKLARLDTLNDGDLGKPSSSEAEQDAGSTTE